MPSSSPSLATQWTISGTPVRHLEIWTPYFIACRSLSSESERQIALAEAAGDVAAHDLIGAVGDPHHPGEVPAGDEPHLVGQAHPAADLHAAVEHPETGLGAVHLDDVQLLQHPLAAVEPPRAVHRHR